MRLLAAGFIWLTAACGASNAPEVKSQQSFSWTEIELSTACQMVMVSDRLNDHNKESPRLACDCAVQALALEAKLSELTKIKNDLLQYYQPLMGMAFSVIMSGEIKIDDISEVDGPPEMDMSGINRLADKVALCEEELNLDLEF